MPASPPLISPPLRWLNQPPPSPLNTPLSPWQQLFSMQIAEPLATLIANDRDQRRANPFNFLWALIALERFDKALTLAKEFDPEEKNNPLFEKLMFVLMANLDNERETRQILSRLAALGDEDLTWLYQQWRCRFNPSFLKKAA